MNVCIHVPSATLNVVTDEPVATEKMPARPVRHYAYPLGLLEYSCSSASLAQSVQVFTSRMKKVAGISTSKIRGLLPLFICYEGRA